MALTMGEIRRLMDEYNYQDNNEHLRRLERERQRELDRQRRMVLDLERERERQRELNNRQMYDRYYDLYRAVKESEPPKPKTVNEKFIEENNISDEKIIIALGKLHSERTKEEKELIKSVLRKDKIEKEKIQLTRQSPDDFDYLTFDLEMPFGGVNRERTQRQYEENLRRIQELMREYRMQVNLPRGFGVLDHP